MLDPPSRVAVCSRPRLGRPGWTLGQDEGDRVGELGAYERLERVAQELMGEVDLTQQARFTGDKVQWNHHLPANLVGLVNDTIMVSPRWMGRGGKAAFTAHALYMAMRIELALLNEPPERIAAQLDRMLADKKAMTILDDVKRDEQMVKDLAEVVDRATVDMLPHLMASAESIAANSPSKQARRQAADMVLDIRSKVN